MKLNIGCGKRYKEGYVNIDKQKPADLILDLEKAKLPFKDNEVDEIYASHILEHIHNLIPLMNEFYRILKKNGRIIIKVPQFPGWGAIADPTHCRFFVLQSFDYFTEEGYAKADYHVKPWKIIKRESISKPYGKELNVIMQPEK